MNYDDKTIERFVISSQDFEESLSYLNEAKIESIQSNLTVRRALVMMAVISYCRPFLASNGSSAGKLPSDFINQLDKEMKIFHSDLIKFRHNVFAHSNSDIKSAKIEKNKNYNFFSITFDSNYSWGVIDLERLEKIVTLAFSFCNRSFGSAKANCQ